MTKTTEKTIIKYSMNIGKNDKDTHAQIISDNDFLQIVYCELNASGIDGATFSDCVGIYNGEIEKSMQVDIIDFEGKITPNKLKTISANLCDKLNQNEIITSKTQINIF
jgi:hypothetical protein